MSRIRDFQDAHRVWVDHNFPGQAPWEPLLGIVEEVGELSHVHLKAQQGIRGMIVDAAEKADALGDIFIYMLSYCNASALDLETCIEAAWSEVSRRDWKAFPLNGMTQ